MFDSGPAEIRRVGVLSGGGSSALGEAIALGLDAFVTGEPTEHVMADAREGGIHFLAGGHYASETFGVRRLGELLAERFGVEHRFIEVPEPHLMQIAGKQLRRPGRGVKLIADIRKGGGEIDGDPFDPYGAGTRGRHAPA